MPQILHFALVLTSRPGHGELTPAIAGQALACLAEDHDSLAAPRWLAEGDAWELSFAASKPINSKVLCRKISAAIGTAPVDVNIIPGDRATRRKKLLIADMDSTIINQECIDEIAAHVGIGDQVSRLTTRAMNGELDFNEALIERVALLAGMGETELQTIFDERITLMPGARALVQTMRRDQAFCALVSGGFAFFTSRIAARVGFNVTQANALEFTNGKLSGNVIKPILGRQAKLDALNDYMAALALTPAATMAVGDGANDLAMIKAAGLGVAYRAKPIVASQASATITHSDLTALLHLQGYSRGEFVT
jgi:phosphoserine phosphatase